MMRGFLGVKLTHTNCVRCGGLIGLNAVMRKIVLLDDKPRYHFSLTKVPS